MSRRASLSSDSSLRATSIDDLARLVRKANFLNQQDQAQTQDLLRLQSGNELLSRLCRTMRSTTFRLVECSWAESGKKEFCELYSAMMNQADTVLEFVESRDRAVRSGFINKISTKSKQTLLEFLHRIRTDHAWVADRLSNLTVSELDALLPGQDMPPKSANILRESPGERNEIHDLQRTDALYALLFSVFAPVGAFVSEDELRLGLSARVLHRLISDNKTSSKGDKFCLATMDVWTSHYGWEASKSFEILLMDILQSGTKIIEKADARNTTSSSQHRSFYFSTHTKRDEFEDDFFGRAVRSIFRLLDSPDGAGLPLGALKLSHAILDQSEENDKRHHESFVIINWFFYRFLSKAICQPEQLGLMNDYYISDIKRHRILMVLQQKVYAYCIPAVKSYPMSHKRSLIDEEIEGHVVSIFNKFRSTKTEETANFTMQPIGENTFLSRGMRTYSETARPFVFLCATDLFTLYSALSPHYRSTSPELGNSVLTRHKSTSSTGSGRSGAFKPARSSKIIFDIGSSFRDYECISDSATEADETPNVKKTASSTLFSPIFEARSDDEVMHKVKHAITELAQNSDTQCSAAVISETWDKFFCHATHVSLEDAVRPHEEIESEIPDVVHHAIHLLLENFEVSPRSRTKTPHTARQNCYFSPTLPNARSDQAHQTRRSPSDAHDSSSLLRMLLAASRRCLSRREYATADVYHRAHAKLQKRWQSAQAFDDFSPVIYGLLQEQERIVEASYERADERMQLFAHAEGFKARLLHTIDDQIHQMGKARLKMWYSSDIRKYKMWNQAWDVVKCLNKMKPPPSAFEDAQSLNPTSDQANPFSFHAHRPTPLSRSNSRDHRYRFPRDMRQGNTGAGSSIGIGLVDQAIFEALSAPADHGGTNKLSASQSQQTLEWMRQSDIHNFCVGEERLHRLCYELDDLARRIMSSSTAALNTMDIDEAFSSALWKFDLFRYESAIFKVSKGRPDATQESVIQLGPSEDSGTGIGSLLRRGSAGDLLNMARTGSRPRGNSVGSFEQRNRSRSCTTSAVSVNELHHDHSYPPSPATVSVDMTHSLRKRPSGLSNTVSDRNSEEYDEQAIKDFLLQTQMGLTSLLLSDFAELLFYRGSETDEWYNDDLTETALSRKHVLEVKLKERIAEVSRSNLEKIILIPSITLEAKQKVGIGKKHNRGKSTNLSHFFSGAPSPGESYKAAPAPPSVDVGSPASSSGIIMERTSSSGSYLDVMTGSETSATPITPVRSNDRATQPQQFPLLRAYKDILLKFSVHPSPYEKLRALYEFELLIVSNLSSSGDEADSGLPKLAPTMPQSPMILTSKSNSTISPATLKQHIRRDSEDLAKLRIEKLSINPIPAESHLSATPTVAHSPSYTPGTDTIVEEMQRILRIPDIRPKTLFRDLQYIASFIPANILNMTDEGKVFWDVGLAALGVKRDTLDAMVEFGSSIVHHTDAIAITPEEAKTSDCLTKDAVQLFVIAAKEQEVTAMRELAILQYTRPELVDIVLPPFSIPSEIFTKPARRERRPSVTFNTASHGNKLMAATAWFELAASHGDGVAKDWLARRKSRSDG